MDYQTRHRMIFSAVIFGVLMVLPTWSFAETITYVANLLPQNNSGVTGTASLTHNSDNDTLHVSINATGLEPNQMHHQHIHGFPNGNSTLPTLACCDLDRDGFIEMLEGGRAVGPVILPLTSHPGAGHEGYPTAPNGVINFSQIYDLNIRRSLQAFPRPRQEYPIPTALCSSRWRIAPSRFMG